MPMRVECRHYESRSYASGETVRKCNLDLAPEAPWRCPENCAAFTFRLADATWHQGDLTGQPPPPEPPGLDKGAAALLDEAENIVNAAGPAILAEIAAERQGRRPQSGTGGSWWRRFRRKS